ncbi:hypothetical protein D9615_006276 [Tricholomella constricta]|uniref:Uncharacterized protein n=1 Tax=Tricholomella constricta TaxID=117010 RepID=A0A8H5HB02_9AGAR|nr:hypothetical protein D9615_006276 [Tricholomella constricta]
MHSHFPEPFSAMGQEHRRLSKDNRWSDVVPPNFLTIGHSTLPLSEHTATLAFFRDHHDFLFTTTTHTPLTFDRSRLGRRQTQTSSTLEGLDVYLRGSMFAKTHVRDRKYSFLGELLADDFKFDPRTSFANIWMQKGAAMSGKYQNSVNDEGYAEGTFGAGFNGLSREDGFNLRSAFSVTTTSTSNYISVELDEFADDEDSSWSTLEAPNTPGFSRLLFSQQQQQRRSSGRLKKRRPQTGIDSPAPPLEVLQRPCYNHTTSTSTDAAAPTATASTARSTSCTSKHVTLPRFVRSLSLKRWRPALNKEFGVCHGIDVARSTPA